MSASKREWNHRNIRMICVGVDKWKQRGMFYLNAIDMDKRENDEEEQYKY